VKLSEAIQLGRTVIRPVSGIQDDGRGGGCAIGMGLKANGVQPSRRPVVDGDFTSPEEKETFEAAIGAWPWLGATISIPCSYPCILSGHPASYANAIAHIFGSHVFGKADWTLNQLVEWIQSVEPAERESLDIANLDIVALLANATEANPA
jgi:hypothetical protein